MYCYVCTHTPINNSITLAVAVVNDVETPLALRAAVSSRHYLLSALDTCDGVFAAAGRADDKLFLIEAHGTSSMLPLFLHTILDVRFHSLAPARYGIQLVGDSPNNTGIRFPIGDFIIHLQRIGRTHRKLEFVVVIERGVF